MTDEAIEDVFKYAQAESARDWAIRKIKGAGFHVTKLWKLLPPDGSGETEVLFRGRERAKNMAQPRLLTAYIPDNPNGEVYIAEGW